MCKKLSNLHPRIEFQEGDEGEREGVVGSGNPFGDDGEEEVG